MIPKTERLSADVLILGGGLAGCMGAVAAIKKGCTVILADKAWVGSSGESTFAAGDILYYDPEQDDMHEWLERWNKAGDSMFDPEWLEWYGKNVHELILMLDSWGMEFEKDAQGRFKRKPGRGHREAVVFPGYKMQKKLRGILETRGRPACPAKGTSWPCACARNSPTWNSSTPTAPPPRTSTSAA